MSDRSLYTNTSIILPKEAVTGRLSTPKLALKKRFLVYLLPGTRYLVVTACEHRVQEERPEEMRGYVESQRKGQPLV